MARAAHDIDFNSIADEKIPLLLIFACELVFSEFSNGALDEKRSKTQGI
jgi:hypothetical protein